MFCFSYDPPELDELERSTTGNATALAICMALSKSALTKGHGFSSTHLQNAQLKALFSPSNSLD